jgi:hypothetical protein
VPPGTLLVRARAPDAVYEGSVEVQAEQTRGISTAELERVPYARLVRKGMGDRAASFTPMLTAGVGASTSTGPVATLALALPVALSVVSVGANLEFISTALSAQWRMVTADALLSNTWDLERLSIVTSSMVGVAFSQRIPGGPYADEFTLGPTFVLAAGADVPLFAPVFVRGQCRGRLTFGFALIEGQGSLIDLTGGCDAGLGASF